jgi:hypothetical protein
MKTFLIVFLTAIILWFVLVLPKNANFKDVSFKQHAGGIFLVYPMALFGVPEAQSLLGTYYDGFDDYEPALKWYSKAAKSGDQHGQFMLGLMYEQGRGIPIDLVEAYKWYYLAILNSKPGSNREPGRTSLSRVERMMTRDQINEARKRAKQ